MATKSHSGTWSNAASSLFSEAVGGRRRNWRTRTPRRSSSNRRCEGDSSDREPVLDVIAEGTITAPRPAPRRRQRRHRSRRLRQPIPSYPWRHRTRPSWCREAPVSLPAALAGSAAHPPGRAAADQTGKAPPAPAVVPPLKTPGVAYARHSQTAARSGRRPSQCPRIPRARCARGTGRDDGRTAVSAAAGD